MGRFGEIKFFFGNPGDIPIAGDFNGDGCATVSIYRPSNQTFYIINELGENDGGLGEAELSYVFGNPGDKPFVGDFDGDGHVQFGDFLVLANQFGAAANITSVPEPGGLLLLWAVIACALRGRPRR